MADHGYGVVLKREDTVGSGTYTAIASIAEITPPGLSKEAIDVTDHGSTDKYREFITGMRDAGEMSLTLNYEPDSTAQNKLRDDLDADTVINYKFVFPDGSSTTATFDGIVTAFEPSTPIDDKITASVSIKVSGKITWS